MKWVLILLVQSANGKALTTVDDFPTKVACEAAGTKAAETFSGLTANSKYVCITRYEQ